MKFKALTNEVIHIPSGAVFLFGDLGQGFAAKVFVSPESAFDPVL